MPEDSPLLKGWKNVVQQALVGSALRKEELLWSLWERYGLVPSPQTTSEQRLLQAAAIYHHLHTAARTLPPLPEQQIPTAAPPETLSYCSMERLYQVRYAIRHKHEEILQEILTLIQGAGQLLPPLILPELLRYAQSHTMLHPFVRATVGQRGVWLAQYQPDWSYVCPVDITDTTPFHYGTQKERLAYLKAVLAADVDLGLTLMQEVWAEASTKLRAGLIPLLAPHLTEAALPLLEQAYSDKRSTVRRAATALLASLPQSSLVQEMQAHLAALITIEDDELCVVLPESDAPYQEAGIQSKRTLVAYQGYRAQILAQLIGSVPPNWWTTHYGWSAERWIETANASLWSSIFISGWAQAAHRFHDDAWLLHCQCWWVEQFQEKSPLTVDLEYLYPDLSSTLFEQFAELLLTIGDPHTLSDNHPIIPLLLTSGHSWSESLSQTVLRRMWQTIDQESYVFHWNLKSLLRHAAIALPTALYPAIERDWQVGNSTVWASWHKDIQQFLGLLRFRWEVHQSS